MENRALNGEQKSKRQEEKSSELNDQKAWTQKNKKRERTRTTEGKKEIRKEEGGQKGEQNYNTVK